MSESETRRPRTKAGLFDLRNIIGALLVLYGVILLIVSFSTSDSEKARADGINANLWMGILLIVVGVLLAVWAATRPILIDEAQLEEDKKAVEEAAGRRQHIDGEGAGEGAGSRVDEGGSRRAE